MTAAEALLGLVRRPVELLLRRWNWKSAMFSALFRGSIFFTVNRKAGMEAALGALAADFVYRTMTAGFYGAFTQSLRRVEPAWHAAMATLVVLPVINHCAEFLVHWLGGTPRLRASVLVSIVFTILSTLFNLFAMRRGALVVGEHGHSLLTDMRRMPAVVAAFVATPPRAAWRAALQLRRRFEPQE